jgi:hypothetical protein
MAAKLAWSWRRAVTVTLEHLSSGAVLLICLVLITTFIWVSTRPPPPDFWRGWLQPASEPTPANACGPEVPYGTILVLIGSNAFFARGTSEIIPLMLDSYTPFIIERGPNGLKIGATIYNNRGNLIGKITDSGYSVGKQDKLLVEHSADLSTVVVHYDSDELLYVHYINPRAVKVRGMFNCPRLPSHGTNSRQPIIITDKDIIGISNNRNCYGDIIGPGIHLNCPR